MFQKYAMPTRTVKTPVPIIPTARKTRRLVASAILPAKNIPTAYVKRNAESTLPRSTSPLSPLKGAQPADVPPPESSLPPLRTDLTTLGGFLVAWKRV